MNRKNSALLLLFAFFLTNDNDDVQVKVLRIENHDVAREEKITIK
jgi:hypothetical protein